MRKHCDYSHDTFFNDDIRGDLDEKMKQLENIVQEINTKNEEKLRNLENEIIEKIDAKQKEFKSFYVKKNKEFERKCYQEMGQTRL